jgi:hypothetical protein
VVRFRKFAHKFLSLLALSVSDKGINRRVHWFDSSNPPEVFAITIIFSWIGSKNKAEPEAATPSLIATCGPFGSKP